MCFKKKSVRQRKMKKLKAKVTLTGRMLYKSGNLKKLKVPELNKYIFHHNLSRRKMSKSEKLNLLTAHIAKVYVKGS